MKKALITGITGFTPLDRSKRKKCYLVKYIIGFNKDVKPTSYYLTGQGMVHTLQNFLLKKVMKFTVLSGEAVLLIQEG